MPEKADQVSALRELEAKATPGPWMFTGDIESLPVTIASDPYGAMSGAEHLIWENNAAFIVAAVEYVRAVLSGEAPDRDGEIERIAAVLDAQESLQITEDSTGDGPSPEWFAALARDLYDAGLRAPSLEGARHPEAGETE